MATAVIVPTPTSKPTLNLNEKVADPSSGVVFTKADIAHLLETECPDYVKARGHSNIRNIEINDCGKGNGYMSMVLKICIQFEDTQRPDFRFVLKVPLPTAISSMIDGEKEPESKQIEDQKNEEVEDENIRTIIDGHNLECEFYTRFQGTLGDYPLPRVYYTKKIESKSTASSALIIMEDLSMDNSEVLGLSHPVNAEQVFAIARAMAKFQFYAERQEQHRDFWMSLEKNLHLNAFYSSWLPVGMESAREMGCFNDLLPIVRHICTREFGVYAIRQRAQDFGATTICQGDIQPFNVFFRRLPNGQISNELRAIIDYQIVLHGNPCFDLARFICCSVNGQIRRESDERAYQIYYDELKRLNEADGRAVKFSYEQGLELFHLAICQQATFLTAFLFFLNAMAKQSKVVENAMPEMIDRAKYALTRAAEIIQMHKLDRKF